MTDSIYALSSAPGRAGLAVVRLSGPGAGPALLALAGRLPPPRLASRALLHDQMTGPIDDALVLWFPGPASFTGEDVAEFHIHGGKAVLAALFAALARLPGLRLAEPGEFSRRAFQHGKLDLTAAEGLADLIDAETEAQRRQGLRQMQGELGRLYDGWRARLLRALAHVEADIDFPEEDLPAGIAAAVAPEIARLQGEIAAHLADNRRGERLRDGVAVVILGPPNAGKSSLLNALARREAAIVSDIAGTTRDIIEVQLDLGGYPVVLADTAGLRETADRIEGEGVRRALARAESADLKLLLLDAAALENLPAEITALIDDNCLLIANKIDQTPLPPDASLAGHKLLPLSVSSGQGLDALLTALETAVAARYGQTGDASLTRARHREALQHCAAALARFLSGAAPDAELAAEDLRLAARGLGRITGRVDVEDVLDVVFRDFCIGK
ncbi:tRNA uridine-5-carboxymethylaminomethyl(34) synthesis GTPase MnmE [Ferrovibrio sp.]|uniref:tRNA uridine-5-carboxymethylaminomethyl(34) synthesis GTPase MnmE n=1 Tax=Ferrovibrio sp. TaxID=1917215 RepID=UPI001B7353EA|nr:tRNA uridine-5-carboxymethylaminomethyl(34) synthesis GTPase MnmE [Ferrovibrio sp.]MBP7062977.1 tRNA uridine-5-carboxymethylaminomethyl(34) synthesis GTPase MnmE [Ferrovibrio sp.]